MKDDHDSDEDPWADKTKEISFSNKSPEKSSPNCKLTVKNDKGDCSNSSSDEEDQIGKSKFLFKISPIDGDHLCVLSQCPERILIKMYT